MALRSKEISPTLQLPFLVLVMVLPTAGTWVYFVLLSGHDSMQIAYVVTKVVQFSLPIAWVAVVCGVRIRPTAPTRAGLLRGAGFGMAVAAVGMGLYYGHLRSGRLLADAPNEIAAKMAGFQIHSAIAYLGLATFYSLVHSLLEEYYWRWFVYRQLRTSLPASPAILISSLAFMGHHVLVVAEFLKGYGPSTWLLSSCVAIGGAAWAWIYERTGCLYGPWLSHLIVDAGIMWIGYDLWLQAG